MHTAEITAYQQVGHIVLPGLHGFVYSNRQRLGFARNAARHHQRGAKLAQRTGKGQQDTGQNAAPGQWQGYAEKHRQAADAQHLRRLLQLAVYRLERRPRRLEYQRKRHHPRPR